LSGSEIQCQAGAGGTMQKSSASAIHHFIKICLLQNITPISVCMFLFLSGFPHRTFFLPRLGIVYTFQWNM